VLVSAPKRRKTDQRGVHTQRPGPSLELPQIVTQRQGPPSASGRSPLHEDRSESISSIAGAVGSADIPSPSESGTIILSTVDLGNADFIQDNLASGSQFRYGKAEPQSTLRSKFD
jgi:hypothetical protein